MGQKGVEVLKKQIEEVAKLVTEVQSQVGKNAAFYIAQAQQIVAHGESCVTLFSCPLLTRALPRPSARDSIRETEITTSRQLLAGTEDLYFRQLNKDFHLITIPCERCDACTFGVCAASASACLLPCLLAC